MKKAYLFDFDGTLVDSMPTFVSAMLRILDENHIPYDNGIIKIITPLGLNGTAEYYINQLGVKMSKEQLVSVMKEYMLDAYFHTIPAKKNVPEVLKALKAQGASLNVLTASPHSITDPCLRNNGVFDWFEQVWTVEDYGMGKSNPLLFERVVEDIGLPAEEILYFDDNPVAVVNATAAGMQVCGVYDDSSKDYIMQIKSASIFSF